MDIDNNETTEIKKLVDKCRKEAAKRLVGQENLIDDMLTAFIAGGHVLVEGVPGLAKTLAVKTFSEILGLDFKRIQFTPDLLPADVTGTLIYDQNKGNFTVRQGPVFANVILADEINRAPAKVQSALLQAMQEGEVTIGEETMRLPSPFMVMATQNPIEQEGTYTLPEAQTDRFMLKVVVDYPTIDEEKKILRSSMDGDIAERKVTPVVGIDTILQARETVKEVYVDERIEQYVTDIVFATRYPERYHLEHLKPYIAYGGSPRATISMALAARALAFLHGRGYVVPDDVRGVAYDVLRHRIGLTYEAEAAEITSESIISDILAKVEVP